jgi:hypothetical protein
MLVSIDKYFLTARTFYVIQAKIPKSRNITPLRENAMPEDWPATSGRPIKHGIKGGRPLWRIASDATIPALCA